MSRLWAFATLMILGGPVGVGLAAGPGDVQLLDAARAGDWTRVQALVRDGADVNHPQPDGATALHWAALWNEVAAVDLLTAAGAHPNARNEYGATPLWVACDNRSTKAVERLLAVGADPNSGLGSGETLLMRCVQTGDVTAVRALLAHGADVQAAEPSRGQTALMWAVANRHPDVTRVLLAHGAAVEARTVAVRQLRGTGERSTTSAAGATYFEAGGFTSLLFAARHGDLDSARLLLDAGADLTATAADGNSPLVLAVMSGHPRLAELFLHHGADPNAAGAGYTALHGAVLRPDVPLVRALLARGADPNARILRGTPVPRWTYQLVFTLRERGSTPFMLAAKYLEPEIMRLLAGAGADPSLTLEDGRTVLMAAAGLGSSRAVNRRNQLIAPELVAAEWADEARVLDTLRTAVAAGVADTVHDIDRAGNTALHAAARHGYETVVRYLVERGADLDFENKDGETPRQFLESRLRERN